MAGELLLQRNLIKATETLGGYGLKLSNRFLIGIPDLLLHVPGYSTSLIECKFTTIPKLAKTPVKVALTPLQRDTIRQMQKAGMKAGWCLFVADREGPNPNFHYVLASTVLVDSVTQDNLVSDALVRKRGTPWPVKEIVQRITGEIKP